MIHNKDADIHKYYINITIITLQNHIQSSMNMRMHVYTYIILLQYNIIHNTVHNNIISNYGILQNNQFYKVGLHTQSIQTM